MEPDFKYPLGTAVLTKNGATVQVLAIKTAITYERTGTTESTQYRLASNPNSFGFWVNENEIERSFT